jgi:hypothetical protein
MKTKLFVALTASMLAISCGNNRKEVKTCNEANVRFLKEFILNTDAGQTIKDNTAVLPNELIADILATDRHTSLIYIVNSECSSCLGEFFDFIFHLKETKEKISITAVIADGTKALLTYYAEQFGVETDGLFFMENERYKYFHDTIEKYNGRVFYLFEGKIVNTFDYISLINM